MESLGNWKRSLYCGELRASNIGEEVTLMGWVQKRRDHGGVIFIDLRDRSGVCQVVFNPEEEAKAHEKGHSLRSEFVIAIKGKVEQRPAETENKNLPTGEIEVKVRELKILNSSEVPPFMIEDDTDTSEDLRLKYRYLDLRRPSIQSNLILRHKVASEVRKFLSDEGFLEIETPVLTKSTPEGARDFLVPSRLNAGHFFALPQSPQIFKQILMVSGFDKYFQITKCFRDEDLRADRQPEFTQIDAEMSFVSEEDVMAVMEKMIRQVFKVSIGEDVGEIPRLTYADAIARYGLDAPDIRFGLELIDLTDIVKETDFKVFADIAKKGGMVKAINAKGSATFTRKELDDLTNFAGTYGGKGLAWVKMTEEGWQSPIAKFFSEDDIKAIDSALGAETGDLLLFSADKPNIVNTVLGRVRLNIGARLGLIPKEGYSFVWVTDFPMFEYDEGDKRFYSLHHPFTAPDIDIDNNDDMKKLMEDAGSVNSRAYDLVLNGTEIGGGSIRIHSSDLQSKVFELLGITKEEASERFGFLLDALKYGTPPHGGIAFGLDRIIAIMTGSDSIRDVIAFPKTQKATCLMSEAPSEVDKEQLEELHIRAKKKIKSEE